MCLVLAITNAVAAPPTKYNLASLTSSSSSLSVATLTNAANAAQNNLLEQTFFHQNPALNSRQRKRHSKRNSIRYGPSDLNENSTILEWVNPCGGYYDDTVVTTSQKPKCKILREIHNEIKTAAVQEFQSLNNSLKAIDINNIEIWSTHAGIYKFLPKLKKNSTIALKRWYRKMQTYVASFAYLRRRQLKWDLYHTQSEGKIANELNILLRSSSSILCELETVMNKTHPNKQLPQISRNQMNKRLKFQTRDFANKNPNDLQEVNPIDLIFVKYYYLEFLENMWKILRKFTKRRGQIGIAEKKKDCNGNGKKKNSNERKINNNNNNNNFNNINKQQQKQKQRQNHNRRKKL